MSFHKATVVGIVGLALAIVSCAPPEKSVVDNYFRAIVANDNQTLTSFAVVKFDKQVESWKITQVSDETRSPATLPELSKTVDAAKAAADANKKEYNAYFLENPTEVDEVRELLKEDKDIPRKLQQIAEDWQGFIAKEKELKTALAEARDLMTKEKKNVVLSVGQVEDVETLAGEMISKNVSLSVTIEGQPQNYVMTLRRYELEAGETGGRMMSRWLVYDLQPQ